jgi:mxaJ protein
MSSARLRLHAEPLLALGCAVLGATLVLERHSPRGLRMALRAGPVVPLAAPNHIALGSPNDGPPALPDRSAASGSRAAAPADGARTLRVCADPNNLPFSNERREGLENRLVEIVARELGAARVEYTWWAQRRGFVRETLAAGRCDVIPGVASSFERVLATRPYYRSSYVFVERRDRGLGLESLDDPRLRALRLGVQLVGDDYANTPPVHALSRRGIVGNLVAFTVYGDYREDSPPGRIVGAVARGEVDAALVWGPVAGFFARRERVPLALTPVVPQVDVPFLPLAFDVAMGVRRGDDALRAALDAALLRRRAQIDALVESYGVPRAGAGRQPTRAAPTRTRAGSFAQPAGAAP